MSGQWAHVCSGCDHLASVHRSDVATGGFPCYVPDCDCLGDETCDFSRGIDQRVARALHGMELEMLEEWGL